jgi:dTDP-4-dehydrorhamnose reductase
MKPKILLTGQNGQLGNELQRLLPSIGEVAAFDRKKLDLSKPADIRRTIRDMGPQLIVNAAAYTAVDQAESDESSARAINSDAPLIMAEEAKKIGAALVHYSTDYIFDGTRNLPYEEDNAPNPVSVYGKTKLAGEQAIREVGAPHFIFRTAWVYATRGRNFLLTILRLACEREELGVVRDQVGAPTWSREIAQATTSILKTALQGFNGRFWSSAATGTYHMTAAGETTWYEFAQAILGEASQAVPNPLWLQSATRGRSLTVQRLSPITTDQYPTPARRPPYSVLSNSLLNRTFGIQLSDWRQQLHSAFMSEL